MAGRNRGARFWLSVLTELQNRGLKDIFIAAVDGLTGFLEAINTVYPQTKIQLCIVHNALKFVTWKDCKVVAADLKKIYRSLTVEGTEQELASFGNIWDEKYLTISQSWQRYRPNLITLFDYPDDIRKVIYTTNTIESLNSVIRKAVNNRKVFSHDQAAMKVVYLAIHVAAKKRSMPIRSWKGALNRFMIESPERMPETVKAGGYTELYTGSYIVGYYSQFRPRTHNSGLAPNVAEKQYWNAQKDMAKIT